MPSRISGACTPCRSKKQKCSGDHPICTQCANSSIDCSWPEQRKRGPAKGYIEALESRLHNAESLLLALLPLVSDNTIEQASHTMRHDEDDDMDGIGGRRSSPPLLNKKTGQDYWELFPIDTRINIRKWQYDCEVNSNHNPHLSSRSLSNTERRYKSPSHSPISQGIPSPHNTTPIMSQHPHHHQQQQQQHQHHNQHQLPHHQLQQHHSAPFLSQSMQNYMTQTQMQTGAAHQLLSLSSQGHHHSPPQNQRLSHSQPSSQNDWMSQSSDMMQLDPSLMQSRTMPQAMANVYAGNDQALFW